MVRLLIVILTFSLSTLSAADWMESAQWELGKSEDGIAAYSTSIEGESLKYFKGEMAIKADMDKLVDIFYDVDNMSDWLHTCYEPELIEEEKLTSRIVHMKNKMPFMVNDRDMVIRHEIQKINDNLTTMKLTAVPKKLEELDGLVRIPYFEGVWEFSKDKSDTIRITFAGAIDPGGMLPAWAANMLVLDTPYETLKGLRRVIENEAS